MRFDKGFEKAAEIIAERGMHKGAFVDPDTGREVCVQGALMLAAKEAVIFLDCPGGTLMWRMGGKVPTHEARFFREQVLGGRSISNWNDDEATSLEDAVLALKRAAERFREVFSDREDPQL